MSFDLVGSLAAWHLAHALVTRPATHREGVLVPTAAGALEALMRALLRIELPLHLGQACAASATPAVLERVGALGGAAPPLLHLQDAHLLLVGGLLARAIA